MSPLRVVVADDHPVFREGIRALLATVSSVELVGEATDTASAVAVCREQAPDLVIMDLRMPGGGGVVAIREILRARSTVRILVLSMHAEDDLVREAVDAGARGYILKDADPDQIVRAVGAVAADQAIFDPGVAATVLRQARIARPFPQLTNREREVLDRMARGLNNTAIAERLGLSVKTVQNHVSNVFVKLGVADRAQAIAAARDAGL